MRANDDCMFSQVRDVLSLQLLISNLISSHPYALLSAEDRVGHVTEVASERVIIDSTPPLVGYVAAGTTAQSMYAQGHELHVRWGGVVDEESGVDSVEVNYTN